MNNFNISDFGAVGDGKTMNTVQIQSAIDECSKQGGGTVVLKSGVYLSGSITLRSGINLHIEQDAVLLGSPNVEDYPEKENLKHVDTDFLPRWRNASFIFAEECENIAITGKGKIDCNGTHFTVILPGSKTWKYGRINKPTPPRVVFFTGCKDVLITDITMINQPAGWSYWIHDCDNVTITNITIDADVNYPNNDGVHINSSRNVTISDSNISCGDDCIVLRANNASLKENKICENVIVTNCNLTSYSSAVRIGWVQDGTIRNCKLSNLTMYDCSTGISILIPCTERTEKGTRTSGSDVGREATFVENISFDNIKMDKQCSYPVYIDICDNEKILFKGVKGLNFSSLHSKGPELPFIKGRKNCPVEDISFSDCSFIVTDGSEFTNRTQHGWTALADHNPHHPMTIIYTKNITFNNTTFGDN